jgi:hypothetical protein
MHRALPALAALSFMVGCTGSDLPDGLGYAEKDLVTRDQLDAIYDAFQAAGTQLEPFAPAPFQAVKIGTFNGSTGAFSGLQTTYESTYDIELRRLIKIPVLATIEPNAVNVGLTFEVTNFTGSCAVTAGGITKTTSSTQRTVTIDVGKVTSASWKITCGTRSKGDKIVIQRPAVIGAGAFVVPALPLAVVYEPPQPSDAAKHNRAVYTNATTMGSTMTWSFTKENSTTGSMAVPFSDVTNLSGKLGQLIKLSDALKKVDPTGKIKIALTVLTTALTAFGTSSGNRVEGTTVTTDRRIDIKSTFSNTFTTDAFLGPGKGDILVYAKNARVAWVAKVGEPELLVLGWEGEGSVRVVDMQADLADLAAGALEGSRSKLDAVSIRALLAQDPFVAGGRYATLPSSRFVRLTDIIGTVPRDVTMQFQVTDASRRTQSTFSSTIEEYKTGLLSFLGLGVQDDKKIVVSSKSSASEETFHTTTITATARLDGQYDFENYYDTVYGAFALKAKTLTFLSPALLY